jgi:hypothetical protein
MTRPNGQTTALTSCHIWTRLHDQVFSIVVPKADTFPPGPKYHDRDTLSRESVKGNESRMKQTGKGNMLGAWKGSKFEHTLPSQRIIIFIIFSEGIQKKEKKQKRFGIIQTVTKDSIASSSLSPGTCGRSAMRRSSTRRHGRPASSSPSSFAWRS